MLETASLAASSFIRDLSLVHNNESQPHTNWAAKTKHKGVASSESKHLKPKIATKIFSVELFRIENTIYKINLETKIGCMTRPFSLRCILRPCRSAFVKTYHWSSSGTSKTNLHDFPNDKRKWTKNSPVPVLLIFSDFFDKKFVLGLMYFLQESDRKIISCKKYIKPRANFFVKKITNNDQGTPNFCKKYVFCHVLPRNIFSARILQDVYFLSRSCNNLARIVLIFNQGILELLKVEQPLLESSSEMDELPCITDTKHTLDQMGTSVP